MWAGALRAVLMVVGFSKSEGVPAVSDAHDGATCAKTREVEPIFPMAPTFMATTVSYAGEVDI